MTSESPRKDLALKNLREVVHTAVKHEQGNGIGTHVDFHDDLFDSNGNKVGAADGMSVVFSSAADGSYMQLVSATDHLPDGDIMWTGTYPMDPPHMEHSVPAVGISGRYLGMVGRREFQYLERPNEETTIMKSSIFLEG